MEQVKTSPIPRSSTTSRLTSEHRAIPKETRSFTDAMDSIFSAITFAEAGEFKTAKEMLKEGHPNR